MMRKVFTNVLVWLLVLFSCGTGLALAQTTPASPVITDVTYSYKLGSGDKVKITVFGEPDLGGEFTVSGEGTLALPLIGDIQAQGKTAVETQGLIEAALRQGFMKEPRVNVEIMSFRPFYILGEVNQPGEFPFSNGMTVMNAVARAGGFTYRANKKKVYIKHANEDAESAVELSSSTLVAPGDTIRIGERYF